MQREMLTLIVVAVLVIVTSVGLMQVYSMMGELSTLIKVIAGGVGIAVILIVMFLMERGSSR